MPNWCDNSLMIKGPKEDLQKIVEAQLSLQKLLPCPQELLDTVSGSLGNGASAKAHKLQMKNNLAKYGFADWYNWNLNNWGTKWDVGPTEIYGGDLDDGIITANFQSAWGPPDEAIKKLGEKFPKCYFELEYIETGCGFAGFLRVEDGMEIGSDYLDYSNSKELLEFGQENDCDYLVQEAEYIANNEEENEEASQEA